MEILSHVRPSQLTSRAVCWLRCEGICKHGYSGWIQWTYSYHILVYIYSLRICSYIFLDWFVYTCTHTCRLHTLKACRCGCRIFIKPCICTHFYIHVRMCIHVCIHILGCKRHLSLSLSLFLSFLLSSSLLLSLSPPPPSLSHAHTHTLVCYTLPALSMWM